MGERVKRQEQESATEEITEVAPGILRTQLPIALPGLGHVNCYVLEDERGIALVDPGLPGPDSWAALMARLASAGFKLEHVHSVVVTHSHPDHFGGAPRLQRETGADLITHRSFKLWWDLEADAEDPEAVANGTAPAPVVPRAPTGHWDRPTPWGGLPFRPQMEGSSSEELRRNLFEDMGIPRPTVRLDDAQVVRLAGREWVAVHTPGHTPDHLCLYDPVEGIVLSGDHVLPTITPHISGLGEAADPLAEFFHSLDRMDELSGVSTVLPAHGHPFTDLHGRVDAIRTHHVGRLDKLREASGEMGRMATVNELMQHLFSERAWGSMAESETFAHLEHLRLGGLADQTTVDGVMLYEITA